MNILALEEKLHAFYAPTFQVKVGGHIWGGNTIMTIPDLRLMQVRVAIHHLAEHEQLHFRVQRAVWQYRRGAGTFHRQSVGIIQPIALRVLAFQAVDPPLALAFFPHLAKRIGLPI